MAVRADLIDWVQARIDEISPLDQSATIPTPIIGRELDEAASLILRRAKKQLVYPAGTSIASRFCIVNQSATAPVSVIVPLKATFLRFLRARLDTWAIPIDDVVSVDTNMYRHQYNQYQVATTGRPSAAIIPFNFTDGTNLYTQAIELFPPPATITKYNAAAAGTETGVVASLALKAAVTTLKAVFNQTIATALLSDFIIVEKTLAEAMPDSLVDPMVWMAASRCLTSLRMGDLAQAAMVQFQMSMDQLLVGMKGEEVQVAGSK